MSRCILRRIVRTAGAVCLATVAHHATAAAQVPSLVDLSAQYTPPGRASDPQATEAQLSSYQLTLNVPVPLSPKRFLILGGSYHVDTVDYSQMPAGVEEDRTFHAIELSALMVQVLPERWILLARASGGIAGGFESIDRRMIRYNALVVAAKSVSDQLSVGGGVLVAGGYKRFLPLPAIQLNWKPTRDVLVEAFLPAFVTARYTTGNRFEIGARVELTGATYAIRDARDRNRWPCTAQPTDDPGTPGDETMARSNACLDHVSYTVGSAGVLAGVRLTSTVWLTTFTGISFYRRFERLNDGNGSLDGGAQSLPASGFFRANITWRIPRS
jgi:hypothetical protein